MAGSRKPTRSPATASGRARGKPRVKRAPIAKRAPAKRKLPPAEDFVAVAKWYAERACADRHGQHHGKWIRLAAARFLKDLKRAKSRGSQFTFDAWHACDVCDFVQKLPHVEGVWERATIVLHPSQVFFLVNLFGFRKRDGSRRFTTALFAVARKNAKSTLAAAILLYCLTCEDEVGPQVISAATTGDQARIVFNVAKRMVQATPALREHFTLEALANAVVDYQNGGSLKPINAKASTQDGLNPSALEFDELHAHKTRDLFDVLRSAAGARRNPLFLYTTTEGYENPGPWPEVRHFAFQVLEGVLEADHFLAVYYAVDPDDDDFDERCWGKANPLLGVSVSLAKLREYATEARALPGALAEFRIKRLNRRAATADGWINLPKWEKCAGPVDLEALAALPCTAGLDLASTRDMCSLRLAWHLGPQTWATWGMNWVPGEAVAQRTQRGTVRYQPWVESGHLTITDGNVTDYEAIEAAIDAVLARFNVKKIAFDKWNATDLVNRLMAKSAPMEQFIQGPKSYHPAMQELERSYMSGKLTHGGDPVLYWNASNVVARKDVNGNMAPDRKKSADKIDGIAALLMAIGVGLVVDDKVSPYETRDVMVL